MVTVCWSVNEAISLSCSARSDFIKTVANVTLCAIHYGVFNTTGNVFSLNQRIGCVADCSLQTPEIQQLVALNLQNHGPVDELASRSTLHALRALLYASLVVMSLAIAAFIRYGRRGSHMMLQGAWASRAAVPLLPAGGLDDSDAESVGIAKADPSSVRFTRIV